MTERLTETYPCNKCNVEFCSRQCYSMTRWAESAKEKLAEYETAEEEGRLVVLPCKVGDVLYKPTRSFVSEYKVRFIEVSSCNCLFLHTSVVKGINDSGETFKEDDIGKTVFLTKEEAEKALKESEIGNETD